MSVIIFMLLASLFVIIVSGTSLKRNARRAAGEAARVDADTPARKHTFQ